MKTIDFGLKHPEGTDRARDLPAHLKQVVESVRDALNSFNYNGKDPNLVLSRVAALESRTSASGSGMISALGGGKTTTLQVTFPAGRFTKPPIVVMQYLGGPSNDQYLTVRPMSVTATGFEAQVYNSHASATLGCPFTWIAAAE